MKSSLLTLTISSLLLGSSVASGATLLEIYESALDNDPQLQADIAALNAGLENKKIGLAALLPNLGASATYTESEGNTEGVELDLVDVDGDPLTPPELGVGPVDRESGSTTERWQLSLRQPLFDLGAWYSYKQGGVRNELAEVNFGADQQALILRVADAYFTVLSAIDALETAQAEETAFESQLEQARQRFEVGLTAITDVHEAQAAFDSSAATRLEALGNLAIAYEALEVLTGESVNTVAPIGDDFPIVYPEPREREAWVQYALDNNFSLAAAKLQTKIADYTYKLRRSDHLPTLYGSVTHGESETDTTAGVGFPDTTSDSTSYSLSLDVPLFAGGRVSAQRRQAYYNSLEFEELYRLTQRNTIQDARSSYLFVETSVASVNARRQAIVSAQSSLEATQAGYEAGTRNLVDVLVAQRTLFQAQRSFYTVLYNYILGTLQLKQVAGNLSPEDLVELNRYLNQQNPVSLQDYEQ